MQSGRIQALFSGAQCGRTRENGQKLNQRRCLLNIRKHFFCCGGEQALAKVSQGVFGVSIPGHIQKPARHGAGQSFLGGPA